MFYVDVDNHSRMSYLETQLEEFHQIPWIRTDVVRWCNSNGDAVHVSYGLFYPPASAIRFVNRRRANPKPKLRGFCSVPLKQSYLQSTIMYMLF